MELYDNIHIFYYAGNVLMDMVKLLEEIKKLEDYDDLMVVLKTATARWNALFPDWDIITISAPRNDPEEKKRVIEAAFKYIEKRK